MNVNFHCGKESKKSTFSPCLTFIMVQSSNTGEVIETDKIKTRPHSFFGFHDLLQ